MRLAALIPVMAFVLALFIFLVSVPQARGGYDGDKRDDTRMTTDTVPHDTAMHSGMDDKDSKAKAGTSKKKDARKDRRDRKDRPTDSIPPNPGTPGSPTGQGAPTPSN